MSTFKVVISTLVGVAVIGALSTVAFVYSGIYNIGADVPHTAPVYWLAGTVRENSVTEHATGIKVPDLNNPNLIRKGAGQYAAMCSSCHLAPGFEEGETREGLYPKPPKLYKGDLMSPQKTFWVIKHGIKMSGMPAWGASHDDQTLWAITAFVMQLPKMTPEDYRNIVLNAPKDDDMTVMPMPQGDAEPHHHSSH